MLSAIIAAQRSGGGSGGTPVPAANCSLLLHMDGTDGSTTFIDETGKTVTANGDVVIDTAESVFGGASGLFPASTNSRLTIPSHADFQFGTGDLTIAWRARHGTGSGFRTVFDLGYTAGNGLLIQSNDSGGDGRFRYNVYVGGVAVISESTAATPDTWIHYELVRVSGSWALRRNGVATGTGGSAANLNSTDDMGIGGRWNPASHYYEGHLDEFLILKGLALHTADFTPPASPYEIV